jgi:uncharacterized protein YciI
VAFLYRLLPPRPSFPEDMSPEEAAVMERHFGYWQGLLDRGTALAYGPVADPEGTWGLGLLDLDDEPAARELAQEDPAVESGVCTYAVMSIDLVRPD